MPEKRVIPQKLNKPKKRKTKRATKKTHTKRASSATSKAKKQRAHSAALTKSHAARSYNSLAQRFDDFYLFLKKRKKSGKNIGEILKGRKRECPIKYFKEFTNGNFPKKTSKYYLDIFNYRCDNHKVWESYLASRRSSKRISNLKESNKELESIITTYEKKAHGYYYKSARELKRFIRLKLSAKIEDKKMRDTTEEILIYTILLILKDDRIFDLLFLKKKDHTQRIGRNELAKALLNPEFDFG